MKRTDAHKHMERARERIMSAELLEKAGRYNDAISRVYYAFFDAATAALLSRGLTAKTHHGLVALFREHFVKPGFVDSSHGRWLARAKEAREEADYEVYKEFTGEEVQEGIRAARAFVEAIDRILTRGAKSTTEPL